MTSEEIKELEERTYAISWSGFPINTLFNDIRDNDSPRFNKALAYQDFKKIVDEIYRLKEIEKQQSNPTLDECIKEWEALGWKVWYKDENGFDLHKSLLERITIYAPEQSYYSTETLTLKEHNLLSKTLKALEEMKDD